MNTEPMKTHKTYYLAGPMSGIPRYNFDAFDAAARELRSQGHSVNSPAEADRNLGFDPDRHDATTFFPQYDLIRRDIEMVLASDAIMLLPGWEKSIGAQAELALARWAGKGVEYYVEPTYAGEFRVTSPTVVTAGIGFPGFGTQCDPAVGWGTVKSQIAAMDESHARASEKMADDLKTWQKARARKAYDELANGPDTPQKIDPELGPNFGVDPKTTLVEDIVAAIRRVFAEEKEAATPWPLVYEPIARWEAQTDGTMKRVPDSELKPGTDPKGAIGATKCPLHLIPAPAMEQIAWVHSFGAARYGAYNWRSATVTTNTYIAAILRHLNAWRDGQDLDPESGYSHLAHIGASVNILLDAQACGTLADDRSKKPL